MAHLVKKQKGIYSFSGIKKLAIMGMVVSLGAALIDTIWALHLNSFFHNASAVGFFSSILTAIAFLSYFFFIPIIEKHNKAKLYSLALIIVIISYFLFAINNNFYFFLLIALAVSIFTALRVTSYGIIVRNNSLNRELSKNEGTVYALLNISWVIGPLIAGYILSTFGIRWVFIASSGVMLLGLIIFQNFKLKKEKTKKRIHDNIIKNYLDFFKEKERVIAYVLGGGVNLWWSLIYLFIPLYIINSGLKEIWVGYFLFGVAVPLVFFEQTFSKLAGKKGFKKIFKIGYLIVALLVLSCFYTSNIYTILSLLIIASIGMAMLEPTTEAYFFDILKKGEENRFYGPYNTAIDSGAFIGRMSASFLLLLLPFKFIFLLFAFFMFLLFLVSFKTKNIIENKRRG